MAERPIFTPSIKGASLVWTHSVDFKWFAGMSIKQVQKSVTSLHEEAKKRLSVDKVLEISTKSLDPVGVKLSAFNLMITSSKRTYSVECAFQASKVFERGGPYTDLFFVSSKEAKLDPRLKSSGHLKGFEFYKIKWELEPRTAFYDWLYINALHKHPDLAEKVLQYRAFSDIVFNPEKSINCQAHSAALYVALHERGMLRPELLRDRDAYLDAIKGLPVSNAHENTVDRPAFNFEAALSLPTEALVEASNPASSPAPAAVAAAPLQRSLLNDDEQEQNDAKVTSSDEETKQVARIASPDLRSTFIHLREHCIWVQTCFNTFRDLFESGTARQKLMQRSAPQFFREVNRIFYENYILQVCKLTDRASTKVGKEMRTNLTVPHLNELLVSEGLMSPHIEAASAGLKRYRKLIEPARNRVIGHADKETAMTYVVLGEHTKQEAEAFFEYLHTYVDRVGVAVGEGPLDFSTTSGPGDVADLFKALNDGQYPRN